jgi:hypothetical protein
MGSHNDRLGMIEDSGSTAVSAPWPAHDAGWCASRTDCSSSDKAAAT